MRVLYLDPGLTGDLAHHANSCRAICGELRRRGIEVAVFAHHTVTPEVRAAVGATPLFRAFTYWTTDGDPLCGWLNAFDRSWRATVEDLSRVQGIEATDLVYLNSAHTAQLMALIRWFQSLPADRKPHVVLEFGAEPGVDLVPGAEPGQLVIQGRDSRRDPRATLYRFAAGHLTDADLTRFHMTTFDRSTSRMYTHVLGKPVGVLPLPQFTRPGVTRRAGRRPITVSVLGFQRVDKGYHLMPLIARALLAHEPDIRLLVHNCVPEQMPAVQKELRAHAEVESRITVDERVAGPELWDPMLEATDIMLCPYEPARYVASYSAVAAEAVANGIPLVVPARTSLADLLEMFGNPGTCFEAWNQESIVAATRSAIADFDVLANRAAEAAAQWNATMGVGNMVTRLLAYAELS